MAIICEQILFFLFCEKEVSKLVKWNTSSKIIEKFKLLYYLFPAYKKLSFIINMYLDYNKFQKITFLNIHF